MDERIFVNFHSDFITPRVVRNNIIEIGKSHGFEVLDYSIPANKMLPGEKYVSIKDIFPDLNNWENSIVDFFNRISGIKLQRISIIFKHDHRIPTKVKEKIISIGQDYNITVHSSKLKLKDESSVLRYSVEDIYSLDLSSDHIETFFSKLEEEKKEVPILSIDFTGTLEFIRIIKEIAWKYGVRVVRYQRNHKNKYVDKPDITLYDICGKKQPSKELIDTFFKNYVSNNN
ncbi:MAG: hypothetical protein IKG42_03870 [Clostridia bacterium]|nr:hypothetical protein [Clostridia bacterium]